MAIAPVIGLGLSAVSTVAGISAQSKQARAQEQALNAQSMQVQQQLDLTKAQLDSTRNTARLQREREMELLTQQYAQAQIQQRETELQQQAQLTQATLEADQMKFQAEQQSRQIIANAANDAQQAYGQAGQASNQLLQALDKGATGIADYLTSLGATQQGVVQSLSQSMSATEQQQFLQALQAYQQTKDAVNSTVGGAQQAQQYAQQTAGTQSQIASLIDRLTRQQIKDQRKSFDISNRMVKGNNSTDVQSILASLRGRTLESASLADTLGNTNTLGMGTLQLEAIRNALGVEGNAFGGAAAANMAQLGAQIQARGSQAQIEAQRSSIQRPGLGSYLQAAGGLLTGAMQLGAFRGASTAAAPTSGYGFAQTLLQPYDSSLLQTGYGDGTGAGSYNTLSSQGGFTGATVGAGLLR